LPVPEARNGSGNHLTV